MEAFDVFRELKRKRREEKRFLALVVYPRVCEPTSINWSHLLGPSHQPSSQQPSRFAPNRLLQLGSLVDCSVGLLCVVADWFGSWKQLAGFVFEPARVILLLKGFLWGIVTSIFSDISFVDTQSWLCLILFLTVIFMRIRLCRSHNTEWN